MHTFSRACALWLWTFWGLDFLVVESTHLSEVLSRGGTPEAVLWLEIAVVPGTMGTGNARTIFSACGSPVGMELVTLVLQVPELLLGTLEHLV